MSAGARWTHFLHIPKTGGTAVAEALQPYAETHRIRLQPHHVPLAKVPAGDGVFFFVRDPIERFVSAFNSRLRQGAPRYASPWKDGEERAFRTFATPNQLAEALSAGDSPRAAEARFAMSAIRHVKTRYADWFSLDALAAREPDVVLFGLQCRLADDFAVLTARLGVPSTATLPDDGVRAHRTPGEFETRLSAIAIANLAVWYADDLAFYRDYNLLRMRRDGLEPDPLAFATRTAASR